MFQSVARTIAWAFTTFFLMPILATSTAHAATLRVVDGQLMGASGVIVDGSSYNVEFIGETCIVVFGGCDDVSDFTFHTSDAAELASQALLDQVFLDGTDLFDTDPELTFGCADTLICKAITPFGFEDTFYGPYPATWIARNESANVYQPDLIGYGAVSPLQNAFFWPDLTYAVWTPVPEPGTAVLMGLGLVYLGARRRDG